MNKTVSFLYTRHLSFAMELLRTREQCVTSNAVPSSCLNLHNDTVPAIFGRLIPSCSNESSWAPVNTAWVAFFYIHVIVFAGLFLLIGIVCTLFLYKHRLTARFAKAQTFIAIDASLMVLGFSRTLFFIFDPYGLSEFCNHFACVVISRLLAALTFPSLTASYTLVFLTLWQSATVRLGRTCVQDLRIVIPFTLIHYVVAVVVEVIAFVSTYPAVFLVIVCELVFGLWGMIVCATFLVAGIRLLKSVHSTARESSMYCKGSMDSPAGTIRSSASLKRQPPMQQYHKQAVRKVSFITYSAAVLGVLYSLLGFARVGLVIQDLFGACPDNPELSRSNPAVWLAMNYIGGILELGLAIVMIYSVNDIRPLVKAVRRTTLSLRARKTTTTDKNSSTPKIYISKADQIEDSYASRTMNNTMGISDCELSIKKTSNDRASEGSEAVSSATIHENGSINL